MSFSFGHPAGAAAPPDPDAVAQITAMGFSENAAKRALSRNGNAAERAVPWILERMGAPSIDEPWEPPAPAPAP
eukprot:SAG22_NODE_5848_length_944_cov_0.939645_1_plen_73_part_01